MFPSGACFIVMNSNSMYCDFSHGKGSVSQSPAPLPKILSQAPNSIPVSRSRLVGQLADLFFHVHALSKLISRASWTCRITSGRMSFLKPDFSTSMR